MFFFLLNWFCVLILIIISIFIILIKLFEYRGFSKIKKKNNNEVIKGGSFLNMLPKLLFGQTLVPHEMMT
jgi:hypothetical protein